MESGELVTKNERERGGGGRFEMLAVCNGVVSNCDSNSW